MKPFIPYEKLSKKEQRKLDQAKRQTWGGISPVTRKSKNSRAYDRKKAQNRKQELSGSALFHCNQGRGAEPMKIKIYPQKQKSPDFSVETALLFLHSSLSGGFGLATSTHAA